MNPIQKKIGEILIEKNLITQDQLTEALAEQKKTKEFLGRILMQHQWIAEEHLLAVLSEQFRIPVVSMRKYNVSWELLKDFSPSLILDYRCFPLKRDDWSVTFAITNPLDMWVEKRTEEEARGLRVKRVLASQADMDEAINRFRELLRNHITRGI